MSQSRRLRQIATAVAAGLFTLVAVVPAASVATSSGTQQSTVHSARNDGGGGWCC